jgi:putative sugar O-methyltransferase
MHDFIKFVRDIKKYHQDAEISVYNQKSVLWEFILDSRTNLGELSDDELIKTFDNFLNPNSEQTSGVSDWKRDLSNDLIKYYEEEIPKELLMQLPQPEVGNPVKISIHGKNISTAYAWNLMLYKTFTNIYEEKIGESTIWGDIVEIGAGYGCLALNLIKTRKARSYSIIDLHENLVNSLFYLSKTIPADWKIRILDRAPLVELDCNTIYFLTPGYIKSLNTINFDVALNSDSLGEMPEMTATSYVTWIHSHLNDNGIFLSKNGHLRSSVGVDKLSKYKYDQLELIDFRPCTYSSSAFDDFSHFITLRKSDIPWSTNQVKYLDVIGDLIRCGISTDLDDLIERFLNDALNSADIDLLDAMIFNFNSYDFRLTGNDVIDLYFGFMNSMTGISSKNSSVDCAIGYLQVGLSPHARIYAHAYLYKHKVIGRKLLGMERKMIGYFCNILFSEFDGIGGYIKYMVRTRQLRLKIRPRGSLRLSKIITFKNLYMNIKERRAFGANRGY